MKVRRIHPPHHIHDSPDSPAVQENQLQGYDNLYKNKKEETSSQSMAAALRQCLKPEPVRWSSCSGWIIFHLFWIEGISGILLLLYYRPTVSEAYESIQQITNNLHYGWLIRGVHMWGIHLLILSLLLHFWQQLAQIYRLAWKSTWILGIILMILIGVIGTSGHLLPWTQGSYWATTFLTQLSAAVPLVGEPIKILIRGGNEVSQMTLSRFFALHILIAPLLFIFLALGHIFSARRSLIPADLLLHVLIVIILTGILFSLATLYPARMAQKADPLNSILNIKPEWYFMASYEVFQLLRKISPERQNVSIIFGIMLHIGIFLLLGLLPFFVPSQQGENTWIRPLTIALTAAGLLIFLALTLLGACS